MTRSGPGATATANLFDFFHERVDAAAQHQQIEVSEEGLFYLTNLLVEKGRVPDCAGPDTLVGLQLKARESSRAGAILSYRELGDRALYLSGFFRRSLERGLVGLEYYLHMGSTAYNTLSRLLHTPSRGGDSRADLSVIYAELSAHFEQCSEVLVEVEREVRAEAETRNDTDILRLYELWLQTGSRQAAARLRELGVLPVRSADDSEPC